MGIGERSRIAQEEAGGGDDFAQVLKHADEGPHRSLGGVKAQGEKQRVADV